MKTMQKWSTLFWTDSDVLLCTHVEHRCYLKRVHKFYIILYTRPNYITNIENKLWKKYELSFSYPFPQCTYFNEVLLSLYDLCLPRCTICAWVVFIGYSLSVQYLSSFYRMFILMYGGFHSCDEFLIFHCLLLRHVTA